MAWQSRRTWMLWALSVVVFSVCAFAAGFMACLRGRAVSDDSIREQRLQLEGDAPPQVRAEVQAVLRIFQDGYIQRDPARLDGFMQQLFPVDGQFLILGTNGTSLEWARGASQAATLIRSDWERWGDLRFDVDKAVVWSSGDVAWVATVGKVRWRGGDRPLRLTAILTRNGGLWRFRQIHFQWDDSDPTVRDVLMPQTYWKLAQTAIRRFTSNPSSSHP